jgi:hypothetical protein
MRTRDEKGWVDETGEDTLSLSGGSEAIDGVRDLWIPGDDKLLHETEILWLLDQDDRIVDAVMLSAKPAESEFIEFFAPEPGNLGALRLFIAGYSLERPVYEFPPVEVKAGEYIVLHMRTRDEKGWVDETGEDTLSLSGGAEAIDGARDLWIPGDDKLLHETEILWLLDQDDRIVDAVMLNKEPEKGWGKKNNIAGAEFLGQNNAWLPADRESLVIDDESFFIPGTTDAVFAADSTSTKSVCRDETVNPPERRAGNWYVSAKGDFSPGKPNGSRPK